MSLDPKRQFDPVIGRAEKLSLNYRSREDRGAPVCVGDYQYTGEAGTPFHDEVGNLLQRIYAFKDVAAGGTLTDWSSNGRNMVLQGAATADASTPGINLAGGSADYARGSNGADVVLPNQYTWTFWIKVTSWPALTKYQNIYTNGTEWISGIMICYNSSGQLLATLDGDGDRSNTFTFTPGTWYHIGIVLLPTHRFALYVNTSLVASSNILNTNAHQTGLGYIGYDYVTDINWGPFIEPTDAIINDFRFYSGAVSAADRATIYNLSKHLYT